MRSKALLLHYPWSTAAHQLGFHCSSSPSAPQTTVKRAAVTSPKEMGQNHCYEWDPNRMGISPFVHHLAPHALIDPRWSILPIIKHVVLILIHRLHKWLSFSEFPQQFQEAGLNPPLALTGTTSLSICSLKHHTDHKCCCTLLLITCCKTQNEKGNQLCHGPLTAHYLTIKYTLRATL